MASLFAPVDIASLVFFRVYFGAMMLWELWDLYAKGLIKTVYVDARFHFTFYGFEWVRPWPGNGMYWHFALLAVLAAFVMAGFVYRASALLLWLGFTYVFLLERAVYLNHYYLTCLLCFVLIFLPAHRAWSIDVKLGPQIRTDFVPAWTLWLLRFQVALPYVFGGIAKLNTDWLQGQPMQMWLSISVWRYLFGPIFEEHWVALAFSWGGLVFDLAIVPLLMWPRTRAIAFSVAVAFHLMNAFMLDIGIFPWLMIGATTVFFRPDWPRHVITQPGVPTKLPAPPAPWPTPPIRAQKIIAALLAVYALVHVVLPLRHWLYPGNSLWTDEGATFSWHMMLRAKVNALRIVVTDSATGKSSPADLSRWLSPLQIERMGHDPEMMREFAVFLRQKHQDQGEDIDVRVVGWCSLNGRKPQRLIDPSVDLSRQTRALGHQSYILPLREPFRRVPWNVPVEEWEAVLAAEQRE
jgi:hypothetical protein